METGSFVVIRRELTADVVHKLISEYVWNEDTAISEFMLSGVYDRLCNEESHLWHFNAVQIAELFSERRPKDIMNEVGVKEKDRVKFKVYCIEEYGKEHGLSVSQTISLFREFDVFSFLEEDALQWQSLENTVLDIDEYIEART